MLSDQVLMERIRNSPLRDELLGKTWPSLSVESKLEIIGAFALRYNFSSTIPAFVLDLALSGPAAIVRFSAARCYYFRKGEQRKDIPDSLRIPPEEFQRTARAEGDPSPLVRALLVRFAASGWGTLRSCRNLSD